MIAEQGSKYVIEHAYVPEHIVQYVVPISEAEPFLLGDFLAYVKKDHLIFVGYPLSQTFHEGEMQKALEGAINRFKSKTVALTASTIPSSISRGKSGIPDHYYRLDLSVLSVSQKTRNMLKRASRDLTVTRTRIFGEEHRRMVENFLTNRPMDEATRFIFKKTGFYLSECSTAWIFEARNREGRLVAFDAAEFGSQRYAIYMFNFSSETFYVPGASDLLLWELIQYAQGERKHYVNLGLGINPGITFFKKKWGGKPFLPHVYCFYQPSRKEDLDSLLQKL